MISERMLDALNRQVNAELYSAYLYLSMYAWFQNMSLKGFAGWMRAQAFEEFTHADKFSDYILNRGGKLTLSAIESPPNAWSGALKIFEDTYAHEQKVSALVNDLMNKAVDERDHASNTFLQWFVNEQVEEESTVEGIVSQLRLIGDNGQGLLMLDRELGARVFTPPAPG